MKNKKLVLTIIAVAVLMVSVFAGTYAFFTANSNPVNSSSTSVTTGSLTLILDDAANKGLTSGGAITPTNLSYTTYLSIRNDSPIDVYARILFRGLTNTYSEYLVYSLEQVNSSKASLSPAKVIKDKVRVPASASASNQELADSLSITAGQTQYYKVTIEYLYSATVDQSSDLNKTFYTGFTIEEGSEPSPIQILSQAGASLALGDKIAIGDQNFWVISNINGTVRALAEYNLNVGSNKNASVPEGLQHESVKGYVSSGTKYGNVAFSNSGIAYSGSLVEGYINSYVNTLNSTYGTNVTGDAITAYEIKSLCNLTGSGTCANTYPWVYTTSYWSGSVFSSFGVWRVYSDGDFGGSRYDYDDNFGVRPVIIISESSI